MGTKNGTRILCVVPSTIGAKNDTHKRTAIHLLWVLKLVPVITGYISEVGAENDT